MKAAVVISAVLAATTFVWSPGGKDISANTRTIGIDRVVSMEALPDMNADSCDVPPYGYETVEGASAQQAATRAVAGSEDRTDDANRAAIAERKPLRIIADPNFSFAGVAVDPIRNEVVLADENVSALVIYDRLTNTGPTGRSEPKRVIEGDKTFLEYANAVYIDPDTGDIFGINNDTMNWIPVFGRDARGNVPPKRKWDAPHTTYGIAADEQAGELFVTIQDDHAVTVFRKGFQEEASPVRNLQGARTQLADPHGIALDPKRGEIFVVNWGTNNERPPLSEGGGGGGVRMGKRLGLRKDFPVGRTRAFPGSGKIQLHSITVYPKNAHGDTPPLRVIQGPKTQMNWPGAAAVHPGRGELFVANDTGHEVLVFRTDASGDVAPIRVIKGPRTQIRNPIGVAVDLQNNEVWVANYGNHSATVYRIDAAGDVPPLRVIRSAPADVPAPMLTNAHTVAFDSKRDELLVAS